MDGGKIKMNAFLQSQWASLAFGVLLASGLWIISHWKQLKLDWQSELKTLLIPVVAAAAALAYSGMELDKVGVAALTSLGVALGLNRKKADK
jgi:hypothetical protein